MVRLSTESRLAWGGWPRRLLAAAVATVMVTLGLVGTSSVAAAMTRTTCITPVYAYDAPALSSSPDNMASFTRGLPSVPEAGSWVSAASVRDDGVAANTAGEVVRYSPQAASRNLLGQVGEGFATTPGGRTVSAHAADRIVNGAAGRPPTTPSRVDSILDNPTAIRHDPLRDTVRVSQGNAFVVVRGSGSGQHIVTVMVP